MAKSVWIAVTAAMIFVGVLAVASLDYAFAVAGQQSLCQTLVDQNCQVLTGMMQNISELIPKIQLNGF